MSGCLRPTAIDPHAKIGSAESMHMEMTVTELAGSVTCVRLATRLDAPGADRIGLRFTTAVVAQGRDAVVDLSGVPFVASMGIRLLISTARALSLKGHKLVLFGATELVQGVFDDAALDQIMPIVASEDQALAALAT
jgi:anti-anti-sigma factor